MKTMRTALSDAEAAVVLVSLLLLNALAQPSFLDFSGDVDLPLSPPLSPPSQGLCDHLIRPSGYPCSEHTVQTEDGHILAVQRVGARNGSITLQQGPPVFLQHGLFCGGDAWFLNPAQQSLGFILADQGFDVWVGNVRGTRWSLGHVSLSQRDKEFWDWSWQEMAMYDLPEMIRYVNLITSSKVLYVGHSQGTIMALAAFTKPDIVEMVGAAALINPISYLNHASASLVLDMVTLHIDELLFAMGIHQLNFRSHVILQIVDSRCQGNDGCNNLLTSITGENCCLNYSSVDHYLEYLPHSTSSKNIGHLFQMIRKGTFAHYDYGLWKNLKQYGQPEPPAFELSHIPKSLPLWMGYGGKDELADAADFHRMLNELVSKPELLYLENYGHVDFLLSPNATEDVYGDMIRFFRSFGKSYAS